MEYDEGKQLRKMLDKVDEMKQQRYSMVVLIFKILTFTVFLNLEKSLKKLKYLNIFLDVF